MGSQAAARAFPVVTIQNVVLLVPVVGQAFQVGLLSFQTAVLPSPAADASAVAVVNVEVAAAGAAAVACAAVAAVVAA